MCIRTSSGIHPTTWINGEYRKDPKGNHLTVCFKDEDMLARGTHVASHGYLTNKTDNHIREATHMDEKPDSTVLRRSGNAVWPAGSIFYELEVAYGHLPDELEEPTNE